MSGLLLLVVAASAGAACHRVSSRPMASFPARASRECFVPGSDDYAITIVVHDSAFRDSAAMRPLLDQIGRNWPVALPLPKRALDVAFSLSRQGSSTSPRVTEGSGDREFDQRALAAVTAALTDTTFPIPPRYTRDTLDVLVRFGAKDIVGAVAQTWYSVARPPKPRRGNPSPDYPEEKRRGQRVIAAFTVDSLGAVDSSTIQIVATTDDAYAAAVLAVLPRWRFTPSTIRGCRVAREIRWEFGEEPE